MNQLVQSYVICYILMGKTVQRTIEFKLRSVFTFSRVKMLGVNSEISLLIQYKFIFTVSEVKQLPIRSGTVDIMVQIFIIIRKKSGFNCIISIFKNTLWRLCYFCHCYMPHTTYERIWGKPHNFVNFGVGRGWDIFHL